MHLHTDASFDCSTSLSSIIYKAKESDIGIAITDHNAIDSAVKATDTTEGVLVIPAIEVYAKYGHHVLFYFYETKELTKFYENEVKGQSHSRTADELIDLKKKYKCVVVLAHPTGHQPWHMYRINFDPSNVDSFEVINGGCSWWRTKIVTKLVRKYKSGMIGGSDAHTLERVGSVLTYTKAQTRKDFLDAIKRKDNLVIGKPLMMKELLRKLPQTAFQIGLLFATKIYQFTGLKKLLNGRKS